MAEKVSFKIFIFISLFCVILSACMNAVDVESFMADPAVKEIIENSKGKVIIDSTSNCSSYLVAGNKKITGLKSDRYYVIESEKAEGSSVELLSRPLFIYGSGLKNADLVFITRISGGSINGLTNNHIYKIREAEEFTGTVTVIGGTPASSNITDGVINITPTTTTITLGGLSPQSDGYDVMAVAVTPPTLSDSSPFKDDFITISNTISTFDLEGVSKTVDYVFAKITGMTVDGFKVLKVVTGAVLPEGSIAVNITFTAFSQLTTISSTGGKTSIAIGNLDESDTVTLMLTITGSQTAIVWYCDGNEISGQVGTTLSLKNGNNTTDLSYLVIGKHIFTAIVTIGGKQYSAEFELNITLQ